MIHTWRLLFLVCALLGLCASPTLAAPSAAIYDPTLSKPLGAWGTLRWGMSVQSVSAALGQMVQRMDSPGQFTHKIDGEYKGYKLAFGFFGNHGLERIALIDSNLAGIRERAQRVREVLTLKYGFPHEEDNGTLAWLDNDKMVRLFFNQGRQPSLNIVYVWRKSAITEDY